MLFASPFRIFFFSAALWAALVIPLWLLLVNGLLPAAGVWQPALWHPRSLLLGVINPAIAGFLLTAVCAWTQTERLHGGALASLWSVWLLGRLLDCANLGLSLQLAHAVDGLFLPLVLLDAGRRVWRARQLRQLVVLLPITLLWVCQMLFIVRGSATALNACFILVAPLMLVIGGRIVPAFSANWLRLRSVQHPPLVTPAPLLYAILATLLLLMLSLFLGVQSVTGALSLLAAALALVLLRGWRGWLVRAEPLLWILHLSLLWVPLSFVLLAGHCLFGWPALAWQHAFGIGAAGGLILGVMTRVALGHTGRPLELPGHIVAAYLLVQLAAVMRLLVVFAWVPWRAGVVFSGVCWTLAFVIFLWRYTPILFAARMDGRPG